MKTILLIGVALVVLAHEVVLKTDDDRIKEVNAIDDLEKYSKRNRA